MVSEINQTEKDNVYSHLYTESKKQDKMKIDSQTQKKRWIPMEKGCGGEIGRGLRGKNLLF